VGSQVKRFGIIAFVCAAATAAQAESERQTREIAFLAKAGDAATVTIDHERTEKGEYGNKTTSVTLVYRAQIESETKDGYKITWYPQSLTVPGQTIDTTKDRPEIEQDIALEFETDSAGAPLRLINYEAVRKNAMAAVDDIRTAQSTVKGVDAMFANLTPETAAAIFGKHAQLVGSFQGFTMEVGEPFAYDNEMPNPFGGGVIRAKATIKLAVVDEAKDLATFEWQQVADPESIKIVTAAIVETAAKAMDKPADKSLLSGMKLSVAYKATANVALSDGWLRSLTYEVDSTVENGKEKTGRTERYEITVKR
jgi:hypothetical protein